MIVFEASQFQQQINTISNEKSKHSNQKFEFLMIYFFFMKILIIYYCSNIEFIMFKNLKINIMNIKSTFEKKNFRVFSIFVSNHFCSMFKIRNKIFIQNSKIH